MDRITRWETAAIRRRSARPQPGSGPEVIDLRDPAPARSSWSAAAAPAESRRPAPADESRDHRSAVAAEPAAEPETLMVPLDAWNRMLNQLGNLHEAGRDLAEARERAARAETEAAFLRERLADLREALDQTRDQATPESDDDAAPAAEAPTTAGHLVRSTAAGVRGLFRRR